MCIIRYTYLVNFRRDYVKRQDQLARLTIRASIRLRRRRDYCNWFLLMTRTSTGGTHTTITRQRSISLDYSHLIRRQAPFPLPPRPITTVGSWNTIDHDAMDQWNIRRYYFDDLLMLVDEAFMLLNRLAIAHKGPPTALLVAQHQEKWAAESWTWDNT